MGTHELHYVALISRFVVAGRNLNIWTDEKKSQVNSSLSDCGKGSIAVFPIEYKGPGTVVRNRQFLNDLQKQIGSLLSDQGFDEVILLNEVNTKYVQADHYLKLAFTDENYAEVAGFIFGITIGWEHKKYEGAIRNDVVFDVSNVTSTSLQGESIERSPGPIW